MERNNIQQGLTMDAAVRYLIVRADDIADTSRQRHGLHGIAVQQSAEAIVASLLMASQIKGEERLTVQLQAHNPNFSFLCDVNATGGTRAKFKPNVLPADFNGDISGTFCTIKHDVRKELYRGVTEFNKSTIEHGLQEHMNQSSQVDCYLRILTRIQANGQVDKAVGILLERLPESPNSPSVTSSEFHRAYQQIYSFTDEQLLSELEKRKLCGFDLFPLEEKGLRWACRCSQQRIEQMLCSLGVSELQSIISELGEASVTCEFCNAHYHCSTEKLQLLIKRLEENRN